MAERVRVREIDDDEGRRLLRIIRRGTLRYFALDGTDHASHKEQGSMIRRYIIWRNKHAADERLREVVNRANIA